MFSTAKFLVGCFCLAAMGCIEKLPLENRPCPCSVGWKCCSNGELCIPQDVFCPHGQPCTENCDRDQWCYDDGSEAEGRCYSCNDNKHCGLSCQDCTALFSDWACVGGSCGCRVDPDCPASMPCVGGSCWQVQPDDGAPPNDSGGPDACVDGGVGDAGGDIFPVEGNVTDLSGEDGGINNGDSTNSNQDDAVWISTNKSCGRDGIDCTAQDNNWSCVNDQCGCLDPVDCLPNEFCEENRCIQM